jgi:hypothetical protein
VSWDPASRCIGDGYTWVDYTFGDAPMDPSLALAERSSMVRPDFTINEWHDATDGALIVLATVTQPGTSASSAAAMNARRSARRRNPSSRAVSADSVTAST